MTVRLLLFAFLSLLCSLQAAPDEPTSTSILIVRHGLSAISDQTFEGHRNPPLLLEGQEQAKQLAHYLICRNTAMTPIYCSDLVRAAETAEILASVLQLEVSPQRALRSKRRNFNNCEPEQSQDVIERVTAFLVEMAAANLGKTMIVVSHSSVINRLAKLLLAAQGLQRAQDISNCQIIELRYDKTFLERPLIFVTLHSAISIEPYLHY